MINHVLKQFSRFISSGINEASLKLLMYGGNLLNKPKLLFFRSISLLSRHLKCAARVRQHSILRIIDYRAVPPGPSAYPSKVVVIYKLAAYGPFVVHSTL